MSGTIPRGPPTAPTRLVWPHAWFCAPTAGSLGPEGGLAISRGAEALRARGRLIPAAKARRTSRGRGEVLCGGFVF